VSRSMTLNDLERPKFKSFSIFLQFLAVVHILNVIYADLAGDRSRPVEKVG